MGKKVFILRGTTFFKGNKITIDDNVFINVGCYLDDKADITIGKGTWIAHFVRIITATHEVLNMNEIAKPVNIGKYCWIGANVTVLPGVTIGDFSVIGAGSVVVKDVPPYSIAVGNPAKVIKKREVSFPYYIPGGKVNNEFEI